ncbi:hypothetical protein EV182_006174, partial [Spiromyces aspiralis]
NSRGSIRAAISEHQKVQLYSLGISYRGDDNSSSEDSDGQFEQVPLHTHRKRATPQARGAACDNSTKDSNQPDHLLWATVASPRGPHQYPPRPLPVNEGWQFVSAYQDEGDPIIVEVSIDAQCDTPPPPPPPQQQPPDRRVANPPGSGSTSQPASDHHRDAPDPLQMDRRPVSLDAGQQLLKAGEACNDPADRDSAREPGEAEDSRGHQVRAGTSQTRRSKATAPADSVLGPIATRTRSRTASSENKSPRMPPSPTNSSDDARPLDDSAYGRDCISPDGVGSGNGDGDSGSSSDVKREGECKKRTFMISSRESLATTATTVMDVARLTSSPGVVADQGRSGAQDPKPPTIDTAATASPTDKLQGSAPPSSATKRRRAKSSKTA